MRERKLFDRFAAGFCFTVVYAALLTKTNRISRIFNASKHSAKRPSFISPRSQLIICSGLVFVQILVNGVWMIIDPAKAMHHYPTREDNLLVCNSYIDASYMIAFAYPIMLIVVCTVYAVLTRKIPEAFNESKHIGECVHTCARIVSTRPPSSNFRACSLFLFPTCTVFSFSHFNVFFVSRWGFCVHFPVVERVEDGRTIFPWLQNFINGTTIRMLRTLWTKFTWKGC